MLVLDRDHFSELQRDSPPGQRLSLSNIDTALTVILVEEQMRGWLAEINRRSDPHSQIAPTPNFSVRSKLSPIG